ncbi:MAG: UPF0175 family protein [Bacteroidetes bacterium]|jgi:predicted HTH domain antitoxin|nr:UPF0175 family protein [Bacteroidota bacterium]
MIIEISDHTLDKLSITREEVKLEVAVALYAREILTLEQASKMADLDQLKFQQVLGERKIPIHYGKEDFEEDLKTLSQLGRI